MCNSGDFSCIVDVNNVVNECIMLCYYVQNTNNRIKYKHEPNTDTSQSEFV